MSDLRTAAQQALEALQCCSGAVHWPVIAAAIKDLRTALEQPANEPVATWENTYGMKEWEVHALRAGWWPQPKQEPISDVTEAVTRAVIEVEKLLCEKLGKKWQASGMSIQTLVDELAAPQPQREWVGLSEADLTRCIADAGCIGTIKMSFESGPYDIDRPTLNADKLYRAIEAKLREKNGVSK